jgi:DNA polymerase I-like protein with 3'-5' exonuclease and polymerase domains
LQQLPREGGVRACITADPGHVLISADFSSVEVRVMAALSQDPELIRQLHEGVDLHAMVAEIAFGPNWTKANRYTAKRGVFGWAYGGGIESLARQLGVSTDVMQAIVDALRQIAPAYVNWADQVKLAVRGGATQMPTYAGRVIHLDRQLPHKAPNYCIQGTARELLVDALLDWDKTRWGGGVVLPVHDEIVAMVPEQDAAEATEALVRCMSRELFRIPIKAEASEPSFAWRDSA